MVVMDSLKLHLEWARKNNYKVLYCAPYGSWNYGVADKDSDVDSFVIVMPSLCELALGSDYNLGEHILPNGEHVVVCDLRRFKNDLLKGDFRALEVATSPYFCRVEGSVLHLDDPPFAGALCPRLFCTYCLSAIASLEKYKFKSFDRLEWDGNRDMKTAYTFSVKLFSVQNAMKGHHVPFTLDDWQTEFAYSVKRGNRSPHQVYSLFSAVDFAKLREDCLDWMREAHSRRPSIELNKWVLSEFDKAYYAK